MRWCGASRALVGVAARSLAGVGEEVTLPQYRMLVLLCSRGPQRARISPTPWTCSPRQLPA